MCVYSNCLLHTHTHTHSHTTHPPTHTHTHTHKHTQVIDKDTDDIKSHPKAHEPNVENTSTVNSPPPHEGERQEDKDTSYEGNETILSNEYTNLDDSSSSDDEPATTDPSNIVPVNGDTGIKQDAGIGTGINGIGTGLNMSITSSNGSTSGSEGGFDISMEGGNPPDHHSTPSTSKQNGVPSPSSKQVHAPIPPPVMDEEELSLNTSLNSNSNNSNDSVDGFEPPELVLPPPPAEFLDRTTDSSLDLSSLSAEEQSITDTVAKQPMADSVSEQPSQEGGILLLSYKPVKKVEEVVAIGPITSKGAKDGWTEKGKESEESSKVIVTSPSIGTQLQELDGIVSDLRELVNTEEKQTAETGKAPPIVDSVTPIPPPPPPLPAQITAAPPHTITQSHTSQSSPAVTSPNKIRKSPIPAKPKPPHVVTKGKPNTSPVVVRRTPPPIVTSEATHPPPSPVTTPLSPAVSVTTPLSSGTSNAAFPEPLSKVKRTNIVNGTVTNTSSSADSALTPEANATTDSPKQSTKVKRASSLTHGGSGASSNELLEKFKERRSRLNQQSSGENQQGPLPVQKGVPHNPTPQPPGPVPASGGGDNVHMQLQFLQQQVLQQQMLQLQQQFQQLQSLSMRPGTGMGVPGMGMIPGQYVPQTNPPVMYPPQQMPPGALTGQSPVASLLGGGHMIPGQIHPGFIPQPGMPLYSSHPVGYTTPPHTGAIQVSPPSTHTTPPADGLGGVVTDSPSVHRKNSEDYRASALGNLEDKFDLLMDEVRDTDPTVLLRKVRGQCYR